MRTIRFRAKHFDDGRWMYGDLVHDAEGNSGILTSTECELAKPETIGAYTGKKDCQGVDIYEGDIVLVSEPYEDSREENVVWEDLSWHLGIYALADYAEDAEGRTSLVKVIGNIHDVTNDQHES